MIITSREEKILECIVREYIKTAQPISSEFLQKKYNFDICPATIRIEMQKLAEKGFLSQPHTSAGRVPTDKGYRFFVDRLFKKGITDFKINDWIDIETENLISFIQRLTKKIAFFSHSLVLSYLEKEKIFWQNGWHEVLKQPEFVEKKYLINFTEFLEFFEKNIEELKINSEIKVYIGKENLSKKGKDFSAIVTKCHLPAAEKIILSLLGPKRMDYDKNIGLINSLIKLLNE